jgi:hypothetical protein
MARHDREHDRPSKVEKFTGLRWAMLPARKTGLFETTSNREWP